jgi:hypothetical protein
LEGNTVRNAERGNPVNFRFSFQKKITNSPLARVYKLPHSYLNRTRNSILYPAQASSSSRSLALPHTQTQFIFFARTQFRRRKEETLLDRAAEEPSLSLCVSVPTSRGKRGEPLSPPSSPSPLPRKIWGVSDAFKTAPAVLGWYGRRRRPPPEVGVPLGWVGFRHLGKKERKASFPRGNKIITRERRL